MPRLFGALAVSRCQEWRHFDDALASYSTHRASACGSAAVAFCVRVEVAQFHCDVDAVSRNGTSAYRSAAAALYASSAGPRSLRGGGGHDRRTTEGGNSQTVALS